MNELHLFAGAGGGILGGMLLGHTCVCAVEIEPYPRAVLFQRQRDGILPRFPIWDDICTFDGNPWRGKVDIVCGGFPCQDISAAGKGKGISGERSGLWAEMARVIREVQPKYAFVENSPMLTLRGLDRVLGDLAEMGYDARWGVLGAVHAGGDVLRERIWIVSCSSEVARTPMLGMYEDSGNMVNHQQARPPIDRYLEEMDRQGAWRENQRQSDLPPYLFRVVDALAPELDEIAAIGNGQVPAVAALAFQILSGGAE